MMTRLDNIDEALIHRLNAMLYLGHCHPRSPGYYRDAGKALLMLRVDKPQSMWAKILKEHCNLGKRRAYELMQLAKAEKTLKELRSETSARVRKHRKGKWLPTKASHRKQPKSQV
jgi:hypothetical protein